MDPVKITSVEDLQKNPIRLGDQIIIDPGWPDDPTELEDLEVLIPLLEKRDEIMEAVNVIAQKLMAGGPVKADPLAEIRGMSAAEIDKLMNKTPMLGLIEEVTGERPAQRTKTADLALRLEQLAAAEQL